MRGKMTYQEAINYLFDKLPMYQRMGAMAYKNNLDNTHKLDEWFGHPHRRFKSVHVAGTNGKGSVSHMLASILQEAGYCTGLYTSPHLRDFRERILINGAMISEQDVTAFVVKNSQIIEQVSPSFFEMTVAMAFNYFASQAVDIAVVEVGLGGRLDSTNIITPELSVITNIGMDHMALLGNDLVSIAKEKAGIIKPEVPVIVGRFQPEIEVVYGECTRRHNSTLLNADREYQAIRKEQGETWQRVDVLHKGNVRYADLLLPLHGNYQLENLQTVIATVAELVRLGYSISESQIYKGIEKVVINTGLKGRWQVLGTSPLVICDTAHNEDGVRAVVAQLTEMKYVRLHVVIGMVSDKDVDKVLQLLPSNALYYFTRANIPRSLDPILLQTKALEFGLQGAVFSSVEAALLSAKENAGDNDLIFIGGSTFVVAEVV